LDSFDAIARRAALLGALNSLTQITLKAMIPGVPDFYQGSELWDLSLVDPDNRRPVNFAARAIILEEMGDSPDWAALARDWPSGLIKLALTHQLLAIRSRFGNLFTNGSYRPLEIIGPRRDEIVAFARSHGRDSIIVVAGRLFGRATEKGRAWPSSEAWPETSVVLDGFGSIRPLLGPTTPLKAMQLPIWQLFGALPIAILHAESAKAHKPRPVLAPAAAAT
jgi:(1->4)-alpha-D-glucan 1-alpha-D-glucosylmutase